MRIQESGENYLETILILKQKQQDVRAIDIANEMSFSKPSVSRALGILKQENLITIDNHGLIELTDLGKNKAENIYDRHLTISRFLEDLGINAKTAEKDACKIEHIISEETFCAIKKKVIK